MDTLNVVPITELPVPDLFDAQLKKFTPDSIHSSPVVKFSPEQAFHKLVSAEGRRVIGADFGGDKGSTKLFKITNGRLVVENGYKDNVQADGGEGYVASLKKTAAYAEKYNLPVGISWGGPLEGSKPSPHPKARVFVDDLQTEFEGDLAKVSPSFKSFLNDGAAGVVSGAITAYRSYLASSVLFSINGGGLGLGVLKDGLILTTEAGHVEAIPELNKYNQVTACGLFGANYTCIERIGANKAGIEAQWKMLKGRRLPARQIEDRYKEGDELARNLYDHSALVVAHHILGTANALGISLLDRKTVIVAHGGAYKFPYYGERVMQILEKRLGQKPTLIMTKDYNQNTCAEGAAIAALAFSTT